MKYVTNAYNKITTAYDRFKQTLKAGISFPDGGLELAVAGIPNSVTRAPEVRSVIDGYVFQTGVTGWYTEGRKVMVRADGGRKTIPLDPNSVQHDANGYVTKKLRDNGVQAKSSTVAKIARALQDLKNRKGN